MKKTEIARKIVSWMRRNDLLTDTSIYFNDKGWRYNSSGDKETLLDVQATDYFHYGNNDTIAMTFEGGLYGVLNYGYENKRYAKLEVEFDKLVNSYGYYYELGNAWNLSLYEVSA